MPAHSRIQARRSEEHTSELQSRFGISYAVFCLKKKIHGGPEGQSQPVFLGRGNYYLNELGIALIYPNGRVSTCYGKTFSQLDNDDTADTEIYTLSLHDALLI